MRQHTNIGQSPIRKLPLAFNTLAAAIGIVAPNSLRATPSKLDAMAVAGKDGIFSFYSDAASQAYTCWYWSELSQHWVLVQPTAALSTQTVEPYALCTWTVDEGVLVFIAAATTNVVNAYTTGSKYSAQVLKDLLP